MLKYKLTDQNLQTRKGFQWVIGNERSTSGEGELCGPGWLHFYHHPLLAVIMNPNHGNIKNPKLFEIEANGEFKDDRGLKGGCTKMTLIREIELPILSTTQKVAFAILCGQNSYKKENWNKWANNWLNNIDRSSDAAYADYAAAYADYAAAYADYAAAYAAYAAAVDYAADAAAYAAYAANAAAYAANAAYADYVANKYDFLIENAIKCLEY